MRFTISRRFRVATYILLEVVMHRTSVSTFLVFRYLHTFRPILVPDSLLPPSRPDVWGNIYSFNRVKTSTAISVWQSCGSLWDIVFGIYWPDVRYTAVAAMLRAVSDGPASSQLGSCRPAQSRPGVTQTRLYSVQLYCIHSRIQGGGGRHGAMAPQRPKMAYLAPKTTK